MWGLEPRRPKFESRLCHMTEGQPCPTRCPLLPGVGLPSPSREPLGRVRMCQGRGPRGAAGGLVPSALGHQCWPRAPPRALLHRRSQRAQSPPSDMGRKPPPPRGTPSGGQAPGPRPPCVQRLPAGYPSGHPGHEVTDHTRGSLCDGSPSLAGRMHPKPTQTNNLTLMDKISP